MLFGGVFHFDCRQIVGIFFFSHRTHIHNFIRRETVHIVSYATDGKQIKKLDVCVWMCVCVFHIWYMAEEIEIEWDRPIGKWIGMKRLAQMLQYTHTHTIYLVSKRKLYFVILHPRNRNGIPEVWLKVTRTSIAKERAENIYFCDFSLGYKTKLRNTIHTTKQRSTQSFRCFSIFFLCFVRGFLCDPIESHWRFVG